MSWSKSAVQYADIATDLDKIIRSNVRNATFPTPAEAQRWRARVYMYRTILREDSGTGRSKFDRWIFRITKDNPCMVHFLKEYPNNIVFGTADGEPIVYADDPVNSDADSESELAMRDLVYKAQVDANLAELKAKMRPRTPAWDIASPDTDDVSQGVDTTDPLELNKP